MFPILLSLIAIPIIFLAASALLGRKFSKLLASISTALSLAISLYLVASSFYSGSASLAETFPFLSSLSINFSLRLTPISLLLLAMSSIVLFAAAIAGDIGENNAKKSSFLLLLFQVAASGLFLSGNLLVFFIFWDIALVASFFFINILGSGNRKAASLKFLIYEIFASSMLLLAIILIYTSLHSLSFSALQSLYSLASPARLAVFIAALLAFLINMPIFPFHSWMPDAYTEAPTRGTMLLSGILSKFGGYGALLILPYAMPSKSFAVYIAALAALSVFYAAFSMLGQKDVKRALAYSSMLEMGIVLLGISSLSKIGIEGAAFAMFAYGIIMALMFLDVGALFYSFGARDIRMLKGALIEAKGLAYIFIFGVFAMVGVPLTSVFVGDLLIFMGAFLSFGFYGLLPLGAVILLGAYFYFVVEKSFYGAKEHSKALYAISNMQFTGMGTLIFFMLLFGILPFVLLNVFG
ncbi:MAG: complex I subunit 4 family protein [Candidatus Micrarchaeia archaeon]